MERSNPRTCGITRGVDFIVIAHYLYLGGMTQCYGNAIAFKFCIGMLDMTGVVRTMTTGLYLYSIYAQHRTQVPMDFSFSLGYLNLKSQS